MSKIKLFFAALLISALAGGVVILPRLMQAAEHIAHVAQALGK